ncbi:MAG: NAD(P)-binding domain-containing protein [Bacillota bacterium]
MPSIELMSGITSAIKDVRRRANGKPTGVSIGNTARLTPPGFSLTQPRSTEFGDFVSVLVSTLDQVKTVVACADGVVDYILVDAEVKHDALTGTVPWILGEVKRSQVLTFKGSDITVSAADQLISAIFGPVVNTKVTVLGAGGIGSKLALRLCERGAHVTVVKRKYDEAAALARGLSLVLPPGAGTMRAASFEQDMPQEANIVVGCATNAPVVTPEIVSSMVHPALVLDVGIGTLAQGVPALCSRKSIPVVRLDVRAGFEGAVATAVRTQRLVERTMGMAVWDGVSVVAGGVIAPVGTIVVDSLSDPTRIIGISDGTGGLLDRSRAEGYHDTFGVVQRYINNSRRPPAPLGR